MDLLEWFYRDVSYNDQEQDLSKFKKNESISESNRRQDEKIKLSIKPLIKINGLS